MGLWKSLSVGQMRVEANAAYAGCDADEAGDF